MSNSQKMLDATKVRSEIMENGVYPDWVDTMKMQNQFINNEVKGWKVAVKHQKSEFGIGAFIQESVSAGKILRKGDRKTNLIIANSEHDFPKLTEASLYYIQNYCSTVKLEIEENTEIGENKEMFFWVPGNSTNHSDNSNVIALKSLDGYDMVASRDILSGEELTEDYNHFGKPPSWYEEFLKEWGIDQYIFKGHNDYVN